MEIVRKKKTEKKNNENENVFPFMCFSFELTKQKNFQSTESSSDSMFTFNLIYWLNSFNDS